MGEILIRSLRVNSLQKRVQVIRLETDQPAVQQPEKPCREREENIGFQKGAGPAFQQFSEAVVLVVLEHHSGYEEKERNVK